MTSHTILDVAQKITHRLIASGDGRLPRAAIHGHSNASSAAISGKINLS